MGEELLFDNGCWWGRQVFDRGLELAFRHHQTHINVVLPSNLGLIFCASYRKIIASRCFFVVEYCVVLRSPISFILLHQWTVLRHATSEAVLELALVRKGLQHHSFGVREVYLAFVRRLVNGRFLHLGQVLWTSLGRIVFGARERLLDSKRDLVDILKVFVGLNFWVRFRLLKSLNLIEFKVSSLLLRLLLSIHDLRLTSFVAYGFLLKIFAVVGFINIAAALRDSRSELIKTLKILVFLTLFDGAIFLWVNVSDVVDSLLDLAEKHVGVVVLLLLLRSYLSNVRIWLTNLRLVKTKLILVVARILTLGFSILCETEFYALRILLLFWLLGVAVFHHVVVMLVVEYGRCWQFVGDLLERFNLELFNVRNAPQIHEILALERLFTTLECSCYYWILVVVRDLRSLDTRFEVSFIVNIYI